MGLAASQARLLLLTAKNDSLELQAQMISNERLLLAQEQEEIANEYSDATINTIYTCTVSSGDADAKNGTTSKNMTLASLAQAQGVTDPKKIYIKVGDKYYGAKAKWDASDKSYTMEYFVVDEKGTETKVKVDKNGNPTGDYADAINNLNDEGYSSLLQISGRNQTLEIYTEAPSDADPKDNTYTEIGPASAEGKNDNLYCRKSPESLTSVQSRYYTEDDAAAQAEYQAAMNRVNALDKRLENKLNQVETQKKAVETEIDSVDQLIKSNIERTFKYFG